MIDNKEFAKQKKTLEIRKRTAFNKIVNYDVSNRSQNTANGPEISDQFRYVAWLIFNSPFFTESLRMKARLLLVYSKSAEVNFDGDSSSVINALTLVTELLVDGEYLDGAVKQQSNDHVGHAMKLDEEFVCLYRLLSQFIDEKYDRPKIMGWR